jgi:drug/metabolite transporter (DMT)-like permease
MKDLRRGQALGLLAVAGFSLTLPMTRIAVAELPPLFVGLGRELAAACIAAPLLWTARKPWPTASQLRGLLQVIVGVVLGFPLFTALAMGQADASHGAVVLGLLPLATAIAGVVINQERPSPRFWLAAVIGSITVVLYALHAGAGRFSWADAALAAAVLSGAVGYTSGARLARSMGAWPVICWAVVLSLPVLALVVGILAWRHPPQAGLHAWAAFAYVSTVSALLGFFPWYRGLELGGVAKVSQVMLLQPFFTLAFAWAVMGEPVTPAALGCALAVAASILVSRRA